MKNTFKKRSILTLMSFALIATVVFTQLSIPHHANAQTATNETVYAGEVVYNEYNDVEYKVNAIEPETVLSEGLTAETLGGIPKNLDIEAYLRSSIALVEEEMALHGSSVVEELGNQIADYEERLMLSETLEEFSQLQGLIVSTQDLIREFEAFKNDMQPKGSFHLIYSPAVAAIIAYFQLSGYSLSAELLTHAKNNNYLDSFYYPSNGHIVGASSITSDVAYSDRIYGDAAYPNEGNKYQKDLYYALHAVRYNKYFNYSTTSSYGTVTLNIRDRYDFAWGDYAGIAGAAVNTMVLAQEAGVIVPFQVKITYSLNGYMPRLNAGNRYSETIPYISAGEIKDYLISFTTSGYRTIQTFGTRDTYMELYYNGAETRSTYDDDDGYSLNSLICQYFSANNQYILRVRYYGSSTAGDVKIAITPSSSTSVYENYATLSGNSTYNGYLSTNSADIFRLTVTQSKEFITQTDKYLSNAYIDTYLNLIDPRSTAAVSSSGVSVYNDDGGGNLQAKITKYISSGSPYLLVVSTYNPTSQYGYYTLNIA